MFSYEFREISKNTFFTEYLRTTASVIYFNWIVLLWKHVVMSHGSIMFGEKLFIVDFHQVSPDGMFDFTLILSDENLGFFSYVTVLMFEVVFVAIFR